MAGESATGTQAVERALALLGCFSDEHSELRISDLSARTGLGQSTVSRMVASLDRLGFVTQDSRTGLYRLGTTTITLGSVALNSSPVFRAARQIAQSLAQTTGLGVNIAELRDDQLFYLANFEGSNAPKSFTMTGRTAPLHATGMGKAILSELSEETVTEYFDRGLAVPYTPHTITVLDDMQSAFKEIRSRGFATEIEELAFGRACLAAPIRGRAGEVIAALSVSGPLSAIDLTDRQQELALRIIEAADEISVALGYTPMRAVRPLHAVPPAKNAG